VEFYRDCYHEEHRWFRSAGFEGCRRRKILTPKRRPGDGRARRRMENSTNVHSRILAQTLGGLVSAEDDCRAQASTGGRGISLVLIRRAPWAVFPQSSPPLMEGFHLLSGSTASRLAIQHCNIWLPPSILVVEHAEHGTPPPNPVILRLRARDG